MKNKKGKFPMGVARFFATWKSGTNAKYDENGRLISYGTHQEEKVRESSSIPVYLGCGRPAIKTIGKNGKVVYKPKPISSSLGK